MKPNYIKKRRSRLEVCLDVLRAMNKGENKPTRIMSASNLSWNQLHREFDRMIRLDLIREINIKEIKNNPKYDKRSKHSYEITKKGLKILRYLKNDVSKLEKILKIEQI